MELKILTGIGDPRHLRIAACVLQICVALLDFFATAWRNVMKIGYARVSTGERDTAAQAQHLKRPKQEEILQLVRKGKKKTLRMRRGYLGFIGRPSRGFCKESSRRD